MDLVNPQFLPKPGFSKQKMEEIQRKIADRAVFKDEVDFDPDSDFVVAGIDQAFLDEKAVSAAVLMEKGEIVEEKYGVADLEIPYIPGLLAFREGSCIVNALKKLETEPDILMLDGSGRIHFRQAGIATHIGVLFNKPAIGVAKNLLCGNLEESVENLAAGARIPVTADETVENSQEEKIGYAFQSRQDSSGRINPLYVSPGHRLNEETSVNMVEKFCNGYKLPEPTRVADKKVDEFKSSA